jgi:hypothetical protein
MPTLVQMWTERGKAEGEAKGKTDLVLAILEDNFGEVPQATKDVVAKITDLATLK